MPGSVRLWFSIQFVFIEPICDGTVKGTLRFRGAVWAPDQFNITLFLIKLHATQSQPNQLGVGRARIWTINCITCNFSLLFFDFIFSPSPSQRADSKIHLFSLRAVVYHSNWRWLDVDYPHIACSICREYVVLSEHEDVLFSITNHSMPSTCDAKTSHDALPTSQCQRADKTHKLIQLATYFSS